MRVTDVHVLDIVLLAYDYGYDNAQEIVKSHVTSAMKSKMHSLKIRLKVNVDSHIAITT